MVLDRSIAMAEEEAEGREKRPLLPESRRDGSVQEWLPMLVCFLLVSIVIAWLFLSGQVYALVDWLHANRGIGFVAIILLFVLIGTPFAFGYCLLITAAGFVYGFPLGIVPVALGVCLSIAANFFLLRYRRPFARPASGSRRPIDPDRTGHRLILKERLVSALTQHTNGSIRKWTRVVLEAVSRKPLVTTMLMRLTPVPFGMQNGGPPSPCSL